MSLASRAGDLFYTFRFVKMLTTPFKETEAFKLGIIDENGKRIKSKQIKTSDEKSAFTTFHRLVFNIKKLLEKLPGGSSRFGSYAAALFLLKEKYELSDTAIEKILNKMDIDITDTVNEGWYLMEKDILSPGVYRLTEDKLDIPQCNDIAFKGDSVRVKENCKPIGDLFGLNVYMVEHINTRQSLYVTLGDIYR
tara:strand:- start:6417 stop:6998 length:582 start_codon:yes stop_codon:yes gene_type:complete